MGESELQIQKEYPYPKLTMLNVINDLVELQSGEVTFSDITIGKIYFSVEMYGFVWENRFTVEERGEEMSCVALSIEGDVLRKKDKISGQFALLDSMLISFFNVH